MKVKYTKEEEKELERRKAKAEEESTEITAEAIMTSLDIQAKESTMVGLGLNMGELKEKKPSSLSLDSPYQDWTISFQSQPNKPSLFRLKCSTVELRREANLDREHLETLFKIFFEQPEVGRFTSAVRQSMKGIESKLNEVFERNIQVFSKGVTSERASQIVRILASQTARIIKKDMAMREGLYHMRKPQDLIPFERKLFRKLPGEDTIEALEKGLVH